MLIAEIGNNHFGSLEDAKKLIWTAKQCGADLVKGQAFIAEDIKTGSMPLDFYQQCQFSLEEYIELIEYANDKMIDLFFSIFSPEMECLKLFQAWHKISGAQAKDIMNPAEVDSPYMFISLPRDMPQKMVRLFKRARLMYVTDYFEDYPDIFEDTWARFNYLSRRQCGFSDHTIGTRYCKRAIKEYGINLIEKHFTLNKDLAWRGQVFRDTVHAADPKELTEIARLMK